jgi:hypothetical protein
LSNIKDGKFYEYTLNVTSFLGGITIAAMILIIQSRESLFYPVPMEIIRTLQISIYYPDLLIILSGGISIFFIISTVGKIRIAAGEANRSSRYNLVMTRLADTGFVLLVLLLIPGLILPFSFYGAFIIFLLSIILCVILYFNKFLT